jgi:hypothetical protein
MHTLYDKLCMSQVNMLGGYASFNMPAEVPKGMATVPDLSRLASRHKFGHMADLPLFSRENMREGEPCQDTVQMKSVGCN